MDLLGAIPDLSRRGKSTSEIAPDFCILRMRSGWPRKIGCESVVLLGMVVHSKKSWIGLVCDGWTDSLSKFVSIRHLFL